MRKYLLFSAILFLLIGCSDQGDNSIQFNDQNVVSIKLTDVTEEGMYSNTFTDYKSLKMFIEAIENAEEMPGILNYGTEFTMNINFEDGSFTRYSLTLGKDIDDEGLLVDFSNTHKGFSIQQEDSNKLRKLIYK